MTYIEYKNYILPTPPGYWILVEMENKYLEEANAAEYKTQGGIIVTETLVRQDNYASPLATVVAVGEGCYKSFFNQKTGTSVDWCEVGDFVLLEAHSGRIVKHEFGKKFPHGLFQIVTEQNICGNYGSAEIVKQLA